MHLAPVLSFSGRAPLLWNSLPEHVRSSKTPAAFRSRFLTFTLTCKKLLFTVVVKLTCMHVKLSYAEIT